jgi:hypothetical protein
LPLEYPEMRRCKLDLLVRILLDKTLDYTP